MRAIWTSREKKVGEGEGEGEEGRREGVGRVGGLGGEEGDIEGGEGVGIGREIGEEKEICVEEDTVCREKFSFFVVGVFDVDLIVDAVSFCLNICPVFVCSGLCWLMAHIIYSALSVSRSPIVSLVSIGRSN